MRTGGVAEVIREVETPLDGHHMVRVYADGSDPEWRAWLEFTSLLHGDLSRTGILRTTRTREELVRWATGLDAPLLRRALEDAELASVSELGTGPRSEGSATR